MTASEVIQHLGLEPLPHEGGFFHQTWHSDFNVEPSTFAPGLYTSPRLVGTAIYGLLSPRDFSALHRLRTPEVWHFYAGDPLMMLNLFPDGRVEHHRLGSFFAGGEKPQYVVPAFAWQGTRPIPGGSTGWTLIGCTMSPGFAWEDFELAERDALVSRYPSVADEIVELTR